MATATEEVPAGMALPPKVDIDALPMATEKPSKPKPILRFRLLFGRHEDRNPFWKPNAKRRDVATGVLVPIMLNEDGDEVPESRTYVAGDIIETTTDLLARIDHNGKGVKKFERVYDDPIGDLKKAEAAKAADPAPGIAKQEAAVKSQWTVDNLNSKSLRELQIICSNAKIEYQPADRKDRLIGLIMGLAK